MKHSMKGVLVILAIVMSLVAVQGVYAGTIDGTIESIETHPNVIVVDGIEIYGIRINYLYNQYNIDLETGTDVSVEYFEYICSSGELLNKACNITIGDVTVVFRDCQ